MSHLLLVMALGGLGSGFTFSSLPLLLIPHLPAAETGSALALNQLLRFIGMAVGSTVSVVLMAALGDGAAGERGFRGSLLVMSGVWVVVVVCLTAAAARARGPAVAGQQVEVVPGAGADR